MANRPRRVVWAYDREHLQHPFIVLGLETLAAAGFDTAIVSSDRASGATYKSFDDFSFAKRLANWSRRTRERARITERIRLAEIATNKGTLASLRLWSGVLRLVRKAMKGWAYLLFHTLDTWRPYLKGILRLAQTDADVIVASRPEAAIWAGLVARLSRRRFVYYPFELYGDQNIRPWWIVAALERHMLRHWVDAVVTQNEPRARILVEERGSRVAPLIVHNYKIARSVERRGRLRDERNIPAETRIVLYEGHISDGRWLEHLAEAVLHLPDNVILVFMGEDRAKWVARSANALRAPLATGRLLVLPAVPHGELLDYVADADVGVIIYDDQVRNNVLCEPGKLADYLSAEVPVVAPNFPTIGATIAQYGIGMCFDGHRPEAIAEAILKVLDRPRAEWRAALQRASTELTWETQAPNLIAAVSGEPTQRS